MGTTNYMAINGMVYLALLAHASWRGAREIKMGALFLALGVTTAIYLVT